MRLLASSRLFPGNCLTRETWAKTRSIVGLCGGRVAGLACFGAGRAMRRCYRSEIGVYEASDRGVRAGSSRRTPVGDARPAMPSAGLTRRYMGRIEEARHDAPGRAAPRLGGALGAVSRAWAIGRPMLRGRARGDFANCTGKTADLGG